MNGLVDKYMKMRSELQGVLVQERGEEGVVEVAPKVHVQLHLLAKKRLSGFQSSKCSPPD